MYLYLLYCKKRIRAHWFVNGALNKCCINNKNTCDNGITIVPESVVCDLCLFQSDISI